jgi:lysozyme
MTLYEQLTRDEGKRRNAYTDSLGHTTIGIGHKLSTPLSDAAIQQILEDDVANARTSVLATFPWAAMLSEARQGALMNLAFNLGLSGLMGFHEMLRALRESRWPDAARELLESKYAGQVGARADRLARQLETDEWV